MIARPDWLSPNTSPSRRSLRSRSASSKPSSVDATALRRSPAFEPSGSFVTSRHRLGCCPRPMRPRSWCSWLMPNRSASITSITVALGTSTPTSITVVQTSTSISAARNAAITASFSSADSLPCMRPSRSPDSGPWPRCSNSSTTVVAGGPPVLLAVLLVGGPVVPVDARCDDVRLPAGADLLGDALPGALQPRGLLVEEDGVGGDRLAASRQLTQRGRLQVAVDGERDGARDGRRGHHEQMRREPLGAPWPASGLAVPRRTGAVRRRRPCRAMELDRILQQRVRPDDDARIAATTSSRTVRFCWGDMDPVNSAILVAPLRAAELTRHRQRAQDITYGAGMLGGKDFRRRQAVHTDSPRRPSATSRGRR